MGENTGAGHFLVHIFAQFPSEVFILWKGLLYIKGIYILYLLK